MKALQIDKYSKDFTPVLNEIAEPQAQDDEIIIEIKAAAVNPVDILIATGSLKLLYSYKTPLTLGNECSGVVAETGKSVTGFKPGDKVYTRLPVQKIGSLAPYAAVKASAVSKMPEGADFHTAAAIPLTGLTAFQAYKTIFNAKEGETVFINGGSGSLGEMAVPLGAAMGLKIIVSGNAAAEEPMLKMGAFKYIDYKKENYWQVLKDVDYVIDALGEKEFDRELSVLKRGGILLSLRIGPNKSFAERYGFTGLKKFLFTLAGAKYDKAAEKQGKKYEFMFAQANGAQLAEITKIVEQRDIRPKTSDVKYDINNATEAVSAVKNGTSKGKPVVDF